MRVGQRRLVYRRHQAIYSLRVQVGALVPLRHRLAVSWPERYPVWTAVRSQLALRGTSNLTTCGGRCVGEAGPREMRYLLDLTACARQSEPASVLRDLRDVVADHHL